MGNKYKHLAPKKKHSRKGGYKAMRSCDLKKRHATKHSAESFAKAKSLNQKAYKCNLCGAYHLTTRKGATKMTDNSDKLLLKDLETLFPDFSEEDEAEWIAEHLQRKGKPAIIVEGFETKEQAIQFWCDMGNNCVENRVMKELNTRHQPTSSDSELVDSLENILIAYSMGWDLRGVMEKGEKALKPYLKGGE